MNLLSLASHCSRFVPCFLLCRKPDSVLSSWNFIHKVHTSVERESELTEEILKSIKRFLFSGVDKASSLVLGTLRETFSNVTPYCMLVATLSTLTEINQFHHHSSLMEKILRLIIYLHFTG